MSGPIQPKTQLLLGAAQDEIQRLLGGPSGTITPLERYNIEEIARALEGGQGVEAGAVMSPDGKPTDDKFQKLTECLLAAERGQACRIVRYLPSPDPAPEQRPLAGVTTTGIDEDRFQDLVRRSEAGEGVVIHAAGESSVTLVTDADEKFVVKTFHEPNRTSMGMTNGMGLQFAASAINEAEGGLNVIVRALPVVEDDKHMVSRYLEKPNLVDVVAYCGERDPSEPSRMPSSLDGDTPDLIRRRELLGKFVAENPGVSWDDFRVQLARLSDRLQKVADAAGITPNASHFLVDSITPSKMDDMHQRIELVVIDLK